MLRTVLAIAAMIASSNLFAQLPPDPSMPSYHLAPPLTHVKYPSGTAHPGTHPSFGKQQPVQSVPTVKALPLHGQY